MEPALEVPVYCGVKVAATEDSSDAVLIQAVVPHP